MNTTNAENRLRQSALVMQAVGWAISLGLVTLLFIYPPGFLWGTHGEAFPHLGPAHPPSALDGLHPYLHMIGALYVAYGILMTRGARNPVANAALFDYGILANILHGLVMIPQAMFYANEHAHLWADIPLCFAVSLILWLWHPNRIAADARG
jgi:hypothetical protein